MKRLTPIYIASLSALTMLMTAPVPGMIGKGSRVSSPGLPGLVIAASRQPATPRTANDWQATTRIDLAAMKSAINATDINAVYPDPAVWARCLETIYAKVTAEIPLVRDENGYRAVLQHFAVLFHDAHLRVDFTRPVSVVEWPGLIARFDGGGYRIAVSRDPSVAVGAVIDSCDGEPISQWVDTIAPLEIGLPKSLETTRFNVAMRLFVDRQSPLRRRPTRCEIGGKSITLNWRAVPNTDIAPDLAKLHGRRSPAVTTRLIGINGAWVRLGYFQPKTKDQAAAFETAVEQAASLRDRKFIVLDVRGNGGGPYNWFMAYLRGLYGQPYADYYATARLHIRGVYRVLPVAGSAGRRVEAFQTIVDPPDPPFEVNDAANDRAEMHARATNQPYFVALPLSYNRIGLPPPNPVRAKVYVLTDYACGSACIGFVDELKSFPGVKQIGVPTFVDSRTGTPVPTLLPSGEARVYAPTMTRDGRLRNDNVPQNPDIRFTGDITDDDAVEDWVIKNVIGEGAHR